jgi:hypothetical protein
MESDNFDPDDMEEMSELFARIHNDSQRGYIMEFSISRLGARDLVKVWRRAKSGDKKAISLCFDEYNRIMSELEYALNYDDDEYEL